MKILQVNKFFYESGKAGGVGRYLVELKKLLEQKGHKVIIFSTQDQHTLPSPYSSYFVKGQDFSSPRPSLKNLRKAFAVIYSFEARKKISSLLKDHPPDIVHLHNLYHHLTCSVLPILKKYKLPVVQTLHDFHLISPNYNLYFRGKIHEECSQGKYWKALVHRCVKKSFLASLVVVFRMYFERFTKIYLKNVDLFISPSLFLRQKYIEGGFPPEKIVHLPFFIDSSKFNPCFTPGKYIVFVGRLHPQKGLIPLLQAMESLPKIPLKIIGEGEQEQELKRFIKEKKLTNVQLLGPKKGKELKNLVKNSSFLVLPSISYENAPLVILEAFALGKPVLASQLGGIPELVKPGITGFLVKPGSRKDLKEKIHFMFTKPALLQKMGKEARKFVQEKLTPEKHYQGLMKIYQKAQRLNSKRETE